MNTSTTRRNNNHSAKVIRLQEALYASRNPTRRWLHQSRRQWITAAICRYHSLCGKTAVEAGSGCQPLLTSLSKKFARVVELDVEPDFLEHACQSAPVPDNVTFLSGDICQLPLRNNSADLVLCSEVVEHIREVSVGLGEIHRVLRPEGLLILTTPQPFSLLELVARFALLKPLIPLASAIYREPVLPTGHINLMPTGKLRSELHATGFTLMETYKSGLYLPGLAEIPTPAAQKIAARLNTSVSGTILDFLLWTQFFVARKRTTP